jgi:hypothetical protein
MPSFICEVTSAGPSETGDIAIALRDTKGAFPSRWFSPPPPGRREMLATALTAISTGFRVNASVENTNEYSKIQNLYIVKF